MVFSVDKSKQECYNINIRKKERENKKMNFEKTTFTEEEQLNFIGTRELHYNFSETFTGYNYITKTIVYLEESVSNLLISNLLEKELNIDVLINVKYYMSESRSYFRDNHSFQDYVLFKNLKKPTMLSLLKALSEKFTGDVIFVKFDTSTGILSYQEVDSKQFKELVKLRIEKIEEETDKVKINELLKTIKKLTKEEKAEIITALIK